MAGDAIWMPVLPSLKGFGTMLLAETKKSTSDAGKASGAAWSKAFSDAAKNDAMQKQVAELKKASDQAVRQAQAQQRAIGQARAAEREATAKVIEAEAKLQAIRAKGDTSATAAAEARLAAARERQSSASIRVEQTEKSVASAYRSAKTNADQLAEAQKKLSDSSESTVKSQGKVATAVKSTDWEKYGKIGAGAAGLVAGGFITAAKTAGDFQKSMLGIQAVSGATDQQMAQLHDEALKLGQATVFSASQAADAMGELYKAGVSLPDILNGAAAATVNLAAASGEDMATSATIASNAMNGFQLKGRDMAKVSDIIAGSANASAIDVKQFGDSLSQSAAVAHTAGLSFHDTAVAISEMGNAGIKGSDAGTSLKTMMLNLIPSSRQAAAAMEQYGLISVNAAKAQEALSKAGIVLNRKTTGMSLNGPQLDDYSALQTQLQAYYKKTGRMSGPEATVASKKFMSTDGVSNSAFFDAQTGKAKSLLDIQAALQKSFGKLGNDQRMMALQTIFGTDAMRAAAVMTQNGAKGYTELSNSIGKVSAAQTGATRMKGISGAIENMRGSFETLAIVIGEKLLPAATTMALWMASFANFAVRHKTTVTALAVTVGLLGLGFAAAGAAAWVMSAGITAAGVSAAVATGGITIAIGALIFGIVELATHWKQVTGWIKTEWGKLAGWFDASVWKPITSAWNGFTGAMSSGWSKITGAMSTAWNGITSVTSKAWGGITAAVSVGIKAIEFLFLNFTAPGLIIHHWTTIKNAFLEGFAWAKKTFAPLWQTVSAIVELPINLAARVIGIAWSHITSAAMSAWNWTKGAFAKVWNGVTGVMRGPVEAGARGISSTWSSVIGAFNSGWGWVKNVFHKAWNGTSSIMSSAVNAGQRGISSAWSTTTNAFWSSWNWVGGVFRKAWGGVEGIIKTPMNLARDAVHSALGSMQNAFSSAVGAIKKAWSAVSDVVKTPIKFIVNTVLDDHLIAGFNKIADFAHSSKIPDIPRLATGGVIPGTFSAARRDPILGLSASGVPTARVEPGEMVVNRRSTRKYGSLLHAINADSAPTGTMNQNVRHRLPGLANGGVVGALKFAEDQIATHAGNWHDACLAFVNAAWGHSVPWLGTDWAIHSWDAAPDKHPGDANAPAGSAVYFMTHNPARHIALGIGNGMVASTDWPDNSGHVGVANIGQMASQWGPLIGWAMPDGGGSDGKGVASKLWGWVKGGVSSAVNFAGHAYGDLKGLWGSMSHYLTDPLKLVTKVADSPIGQMVGKLPGALVGGLEKKAKSFLSGLFSDSGATTNFGSGPAAFEGWWKQAVSINPALSPYHDAANITAKNESGYNPNAVNNWDSNAARGTPSKGLMQMIEPTFRQYAYPGHNSWLDPVDQLLAWYNYDKARYGNPNREPGVVNISTGAASYAGYAKGTNNADPGWHWVGENGPELIRFQGGEQVLSNDRWRSFVSIANRNIEQQSHQRDGEARGQRVINLNGPFGPTAKDIMNEAEKRDRQFFAAAGLAYV